jgi:hypothetical protein
LVSLPNPQKHEPSHSSYPLLSRRNFLKMSGLTAVGLLLVRCNPFKKKSVLKRPAGYLVSAVQNGSIADYTYMWWANGLRDKQPFFNIQTSRFGLSFDIEKCTLRKLGAIAAPLSEAAALTQDNTTIEALPDTSLEAALEANGNRFQLLKIGEMITDSKIVESGHYFQRRWSTYPIFEKDAPEIKPRESGIEVSAWPDRAAFILRLIPIETIENGALSLTFQLPADCTQAAASGEIKALSNPQGSGYIFVKILDADTLSVENNRVTIRHAIPAGAPGDQEQSVGLVIYPAVDVQAALPAAAAAEMDPLKIEAAQVKPEAQTLGVHYNRETGWHQIDLRNDGDVSDYSESTNHRIEQVAVSIQNNDSVPHSVRLNFGKEMQVFGITGLSAVLRDAEQNPLGIAVQLSKDWHTGGGDPREGIRYQGPWYHGLVMLTVPAGKTISFEYASVNAFWGQLPAASHAQLSLIGWGNNQLWDQSAIGSWGESLCFEPDQGQVGGAVLDTRPLMVWSMFNEAHRKWAWTNNVGGADFLVYYDKDVEKQHNSRMKTFYRRNCPNLTEVTYAGTTHDKKIDLHYTVSLYRTDDIVRGVYTFRYDVKEKVDFSRLVLFQCSGDDYGYTGEKKFAYGSEQGMTKEWLTQWGGFAYRTDRMELQGAVPWVSMHEAVSRDTSGNGAWANRGLIVRRWQAVLGGKKANPWIAERGALVRGVDTSLVDFLLPPDVTELLPGDFVEARIIHVVMPQYAADYYGPNTNLAEALKTGENTWKMIYREAVANNLEVKVTQGGELEQTYPIRIHGSGGDIVFNVAGGAGFVPVTFSGVPNYRGFTLEHKENGQWRAVDQSYYGKDFWQTDYDALTGAWEITYNLALDTPGDQRQNSQFRFTAPTPYS